VLWAVRQCREDPSALRLKHFAGNQGRHTRVLYRVDEIWHAGGRRQLSGVSETKRRRLGQGRSDEVWLLETPEGRHVEKVFIH
jgi:hypothetical protein